MTRYAKSLHGGTAVRLMPDSMTPVDIAMNDGYVEIHSSIICPALERLSDLEDREARGIPEPEIYARMTSLLADEARRQVAAIRKNWSGPPLRRFTPQDYLNMAELFVSQRKSGLSDTAKWEVTLKTYLKRHG